MANLVMNGNYHPPAGTDKYANRLLRQLSMSDLALDAELTPQGIPIQVWKNTGPQLKKERPVDHPH